MWGSIRGHTGLKCVNPFLLPCGFIQPETEVEMEERKEVIYDYDMQVENTKPFSKLQGSVFFVSISSRKNKQGITKVHYKGLRYHDVCVFASPCQTYQEAMIKDSRFIDVDHFTLRQKVVGAAQGAKIAINEKPVDLGKEIVLEVTVNRAVQSTADKCSTTSNNSNYPMASTSGSTRGVDPAERSVFESPRKKRNFNKLTVKLWEENAVYVFSKDVDDLTNQEMLTEMEECLRARACCTLVGPQDRGEKKYQKSLEKHAKDEFSNSNVISRPVQFTKSLCELYDSIGFLLCGGVISTCFLVSKNMIATNWHVVNKIKIARRASTHHDHSVVKIYFRYENNGVPLSNINGHKLKPLSDEGNVICRRLDYAFLFLEEFVEGIVLGDRVRCAIPEHGNVCVVGHPRGEEKQDELCPILPLHDDGRSLELERRYEENELHCRNNQSSCALAYIGQKCVHSHHSSLQQLRDETNAVTYDTGSMFKGSSGAPVFNMKCKIVALHTAGFLVGINDTRSIIEFGITFESIIADLEASGRSQFVRKHFPFCYGVEHMEVD